MSAAEPMDVITDIEMVPIKDLVVAKENPRDADTLDLALLEALADSIFTVGLLTPLIGYAEGNHVHIVAGGRRTRALHMIYEDERGKQFDGIVAVQMIDKKNASETGIAEQLSHVAMSDQDKARAYYHLADKGLPVPTIAKMIGATVRSVNAIAETRKLPGEYLEAFLTGELNLTQAIGLLLWDKDLEGMKSVFNTIKRDPDYLVTMNDFRELLDREHTIWDNSPYKGYVTQEDYLKAEGELQTDLLSDDVYILSPHVLATLAEPKIATLVEKNNSEYGEIIQCEPEEYGGFYNRSHKTFLGVNDLTPEEQEWWDNNSYRWNFETEEEEAEHKTRKEELQERAKPKVPDEAKPFLKVHWAMTPGWGDGFAVFQDVLPDDLEPFYEKGWLNRPETKADGPDAEPEAKPVVSAAFQKDIDAIKLHVARMELAAKPEKVLTLLSEVLTHGEYGFDFGWNISNEIAVEEGSFVPSKEWSAVIHKSFRAKATRLKSGPADAIQMATHAALRRMASIPKGVRITPTIIRKYYTPCPVTIGRYKSSQLKDMVLRLMGKGEYDPTKWKKQQLVDTVVKLAAKHPKWMPDGFS